MKRPPIVLLSAIDWNFTWQRHQILSSFFAGRGYEVTYVGSTMIKNPGFQDSFMKLRRKFTGMRSDEYQICERVRIVKPFVLPPTYFFFRFGNSLLFIDRLLRDIGGATDDRPIVVCYIPNRTTVELIEKMNPRLLIYDCVSNYSGLDDVPHDTDEIERWLVSRSDIVVADSDFLVNKMRSLRADVAQIMPGADYDLFSQANTGMVRDVRKVCYFGGIRNDRIDIEVMLDVASRLRDIEFLFIGPVNCSIPAFPGNVRFTGMVPHRALPSYIRDCDCVLFPYRINRFTQGIIPAKFYEAFATGKPVIASPLENFFPFKDVIVLAKTADEYVHAITHIKQYEREDAYSSRVSLAREHSWDAQCGKFLRLIEDRLAA